MAKGRKLSKKVFDDTQEDFYAMTREAREARVKAVASKHGQIQKEQNLVGDLDAMSID